MKLNLSTKSLAYLEGCRTVDRMDDSLYGRFIVWSVNRKLNPKSILM